MTRQDIDHLVQVTHSLRGKIVKEGEFQSSPFTESDFDQFIDRMLWAIHASHGNPHFDEERFRRAARGEDGLQIFP